MYFSSNSVRLLFIKLLIFCLIYDHQWSVSSHSIVNKTGKSSLNRKNDKFYRYFHKNIQLSTPGSEWRYSIDRYRNDQKLNTSLSVSIPDPIPNNEFTEFFTPHPSQYRPTQLDASTVKESNKECECVCDPYLKANQLINDFVLNDNEDPDMDIDDNEELEKLQKPYKYIPLETIELAHQRPQRVTTTPSPPSQQKLTNFMQSITHYIRFPKFSTTDALELGISLAITGLLGAMGLTSLSPYHTLFKELRRTTGFSDRNQGYYNKFYSRQFNSTDDLFNLIYQWIQSIE